jgi:hypothetical protein
VGTCALPPLHVGPPVHITAPLCASAPVRLCPPGVIARVNPVIAVRDLDRGGDGSNHLRLLYSAFLCGSAELGSICYILSAGTIAGEDATPLVRALRSIMGVLNPPGANATICAFGAGVRLTPSLQVIDLLRVTLLLRLERLVCWYLGPVPTPLLRYLCCVHARRVACALAIV